MNYSKKWLILILVLTAMYSFAQKNTLVLPNPTPPPGNMKLLPDYTHEKRQGIDSAVGIIFKKDGLSISYDIGEMAGNYVASVYSREKQNVVWIKSQKINNEEVTFLYLKDGKIYASFNKIFVNFFADTKSQEDIVDFLLMVMTYGSKDEPKNVKEKE